MQPRRVDEADADGATVRRYADAGGDVTDYRTTIIRWNKLGLPSWTS